MITHLRKKKVARTFSITMVAILLFQLGAPTNGYALTSGPSQPEFSSFEPIGTTEMVNLFTGDFVYNIPLMTVPGPGGGYPINLSYHAGIGLDQEASWVGLGWNINAGAINRSMRGLPDDFNGDIIKKKFYSKPNTNVAVTGSGVIEKFNFGDIGVNVGLYWNSYKGVGVTAGINTSSSLLKILNVGADLNFDSNSGLSINPNISLPNLFSVKSRKFGIGIGAQFHSMQGLKDMTFDATGSRKHWIHGNQSSRKSISFSVASAVPSTAVAMKGFNIGVGTGLGAAAIGIFGKLNIAGNFSYSYVSDDSKDEQRKSYGYLYAHNSNPENDLQDFNRAKQYPITKSSPTLAIPNFTYDVFSVSGQGIGGSFRPHRSDFGVLNDPTVKSSNGGGDATIDVGIALDIKVGVDVNGHYSFSTSGGWEDAAAFRQLYDFKGEIEGDNKNLYESSYFKAAGDVTASEPDIWKELRYDQPISPHVNVSMTESGTFRYGLSEAFVTERYGEGIIGKSIKGHREKRARRTDNMITRTINELGGSSAQTPGSYITPSGGSARIQTEPSQYNYENNIDHQVGAVECLTADGYRYNYDIPVYNNTQKQVAFAINSPNYFTGTGESKGITQYSSQYGAIPNNDDGEDEFFSSTEIPKYAHSFLLTSVTSPDYIDVTGNGPSDDDLGSWTKFYYTKTSSDFGWREPYKGANYSPGYISNQNDDKASYIYGEKEIYMLSAVETKTHLAEFTLLDRKDGRGVSDEHNAADASSSSPALKYLDKIDLYSKSDPSYGGSNPKPLKTVEFEYDYSLCKKVQNNMNSSVDDGKLTLKKVYFSHLGRSKTALKPYTFTYEERASQNPEFKKSAVDRWGNYRYYTNTEGGYGNHVNNPYVKQQEDYDGDGDIDNFDKQLRDDHASAWSLRKIELPSGGEINVEYEVDDYKYVQDRKAMQMMEIVGSTTPSGTLLDDQGNGLRLFFKLDDPSISAQEVVDKYITGVNNMFFKVYMDMKRDPAIASTNMMKDYVEGYANISGGGKSGNYGYVNLVPVKKFGDHGSDVNPITKAGWQYMRMQRPDLFYSPNSGSLNQGVLEVVGAVWGFFKSLGQLLTGYYNHCDINKYCRNLSSDPDYKSYIRLNTPDGVKYGGGHRVKKITLNDGWSGLTGSVENDFSYGQEYEYTLKDGSSSGVAAYEPMIGGEENPLRQPLRYDTDNFIARDSELYAEEPIGESFYPSPVVGYSRVITRNIIRNEEVDVNGDPLNKGSMQGTNVSEFYTARDFPAITKYSSLNTDKNFNLPIVIPFIGGIKINSKSYSQGFVVQLNDMHGKLKRQSVYSYSDDINGSSPSGPTSSIEYTYHTQSPYREGRANLLKNKVPVIYGEKLHSVADLGKEVEYYLDLQENRSVSTSAGAQIDVHLLYFFFAYIPFVSVIPNIDYSESQSNTVVGNKVITRTGILKKVSTTQDGWTSEAENLFYDSETGTPLVTRVTNEFGDHEYNMSIPGHWYYPGDKGAYKNIGAYFESGDYSVSGNNEVTIGALFDHRDHFTVGDKLKIGSSSNHYYVGEVTRTHIIIEANTTSGSSVDPSSISNGNFKVVRSGFKNNLNQMVGSVKSLKNPVEDRKFPVLDAINNAVAVYINAPTGFPKILGFSSIDDCGGYSWQGSIATVDEIANLPASTCSCGVIGGMGPRQLYVYATRTNVVDQTTDDVCFTITFPESIVDVIYSFAKHGNKWVATDRFSGGIGMTYECSLDYCSSGIELSTGCLDQVISSQAFNRTDDIPTDYSGVFDNDGNLVDLSSLLSKSDYENGKRGIWRTQASYNYYTDRDYSDLGDPTYRNKASYTDFEFFNFNDPISANEKWRSLNEATLYNPFGMEIENKDALNVYSSALFGYANTLNTAVAVNASHSEIAFDGMEERSSSNLNQPIGHFRFNAGAGASVSVSQAESHSGNQSLFITNTLEYQPTSSGSDGLHLERDTKYQILAWVKGNGNIEVSDGTNTTSSITVASNIDGWNLVKVIFSTPQLPAEVYNIRYRFTGTSAGSYYDDVRIQPLRSQMTTYVYEPDNLKVSAIMDARNFSTFYTYDEVGNLVKTSLETERGILTNQAGRKNLRQ